MMRNRNSQKPSQLLTSDKAPKEDNLEAPVIAAKIVMTSQEPKGEGHPYVSEEDSGRIRSHYTRSTNIKMQESSQPFRVQCQNKLFELL